MQLNRLIDEQGMIVAEVFARDERTVRVCWETVEYAGETIQRYVRVGDVELEVTAVPVLVAALEAAAAAAKEVA